MKRYIASYLVSLLVSFGTKSPGFKSRRPDFTVRRPVVRQFRSLTHFLRLATALLLAVSLQACTHWRLLSDPKDLAVRPQGTVRLTTDGDPRHLIVKNPTISGDSIVWTVPERGSIPLSEVEWVEARAPDRMRTGFFVLAGVGCSSLIVLLNN
jgi:hypothetical protein